MKFDFVIGNPPYQEDQKFTSDNPIYHHFMDAAFDLGEKVELITLARFLFNAGKTPKAWREKILSDEHIKVLDYEEDATKVFEQQILKGGVAITYRDSKKTFGKIGIYIKNDTMRDIIAKVKQKKEGTIDTIVFSPESYKFTETLHKENPKVKDILSKGHEFDITTNIFEKLDGVVFYETLPIKKELSSKDYVKLLGRKDNERTYRYILRKYLRSHKNLDCYKVFFPKSNGSGKFGEPMSDAIVGEAGEGHTQTFISMGCFATKNEAISLNKYLRCKLTRALLGVLKVTQDNKKNVWKHVPTQDFTKNSDINWSLSVAKIDQQLYKKYKLTKPEIAFIENNVQEMD